MYTHTKHAHTLDPVKCDTCGATMCRYPWHVVFTGIRILMVGDIFDGGYFNDNEDGQYTGYQ